MRRDQLIALTIDTSASALREQQVRSLIEAGIVRNPDVVRCALGLTDRAFRAFCEQLGTNIVTTGKRSDDADDGVSEPDADELKRMAHMTGQSVSEIRKAMKAKRDAERCDEVDTKSLARNGLKAHYPGPIGESSMERQTSRELHASIAPDDQEGEAAKGAAVLRELRALAGGEPKRTAGLSTLGTERAGTVISTRKG